MRQVILLAGILALFATGASAKVRIGTALKIKSQPARAKFEQPKGKHVR